MSSAGKLFNLVKIALPLSKEIQYARQLGGENCVVTNRPPRYSIDGRLCSDIIKEEVHKETLPPIGSYKNLDATISEEDMKQAILSDNQKKMNPNKLCEQINKFKEKNYVQVMEDMEKLKNIYFQEFLEALHTKIHEQEKMLESHGKKKAPTNKSSLFLQKQVLEKKDPSENSERGPDIPDKFLEEIVLLQKQFIDEGKISTRADMDQFWMDIQKPEFQKRHLNSINIAINEHSIKRLSLSMKLPELDAKEHWAVTQAMRRHIHRKSLKSRPSWVIKPRKSLKIGGHKTLKPKSDIPVGQPSYMESKPFPQLYCMRAKSQVSLNQQSQIFSQIAAKEHERKKTRRMVERMYQLSLTNQVLTDRLLERHKNDLAFSIEHAGPRVCDILKHYHLKSQQTANDIRVVTSSPRPRTVVGVLDTLNEVNVSTECRTQPVGSSISDGNVSQTDVPAPLVPLTIDALMKKNKILESTIPSGMWPNYVTKENTDQPFS